MVTRNKYTVLSEINTEKRASESWLETLHRWLVRCPQCREMWLVIGAGENDRYVCKKCGHGFVIKLAIESKRAAGQVDRDAA